MSVDIYLQTTQASKKMNPAAHTQVKDDEKYIQARKSDVKDQIDTIEDENSDTTLFDLLLSHSQKDIPAHGLSKQDNDKGPDFALVENLPSQSRAAEHLPEPIKNLLNSLIAENGDVITLNALNDDQINALVENIMDQISTGQPLYFKPNPDHAKTPQNVTDSLVDSRLAPGQTALERITQRLSSFINNNDPNLTAVNLNPQDITSLEELKAQLLALQNLHKAQHPLPEDMLENIASLQSDLASILSSVVKIVPAINKQAVPARSQGPVNTSPVPALQNPGQQHAASGQNSQANQSNLNPLTQPHTPPQNDGADMNIFMQTAQAPEEAGDAIEFQKLMKRAQNLANTAPAPKAQATGNAALAHAAASASSQAQPSAQGALNGWPFAFDGSLFAPSGWGSYNAAGFDEYGMPAASTALNSASMTNVITQAQSAGHAHPGTQMVAATLQKLGANGENRQITLRLDPPALGRVEVKMNIASDGKLDAVIKAERPETHLMLQRDAQTLERAMQQLGLDADGSLSFELADQGFDFDQNGHHENGRTAGISGQGESEDDMEIIESTMTWFVDERTGHMRYDLIV